MKQIVVYHSDNNEFNFFDTEKEAELYLDEVFIEDDEFSQDMINGDYFIALVLKKSLFVETAKRKDYSESEWAGMGYSQELESVGYIAMKPVIDPAETIKSLIEHVDVDSWWNGLNDLQKQNMANLVFNQDDEWINLDKFSIGYPEKKLMWLYSKVL